MKEENRLIHSVWIGKRLSLMERLTIRLFQKQGHEVHLWAYEPIDNVPEGVVVEDASAVMPKSSIFQYEGKPFNLLPGGGLGSYAHWSDQFQLNLLFKYGGIYSQLDVACLKPLDFEEAYVFAPLGRKGISSYLMKCPKGSAFAKECYEVLGEKINKNTTASVSWQGSMSLIAQFVKKHGLFKMAYLIPSKNAIEQYCGQPGPFNSRMKLPADVYILHWGNAANHETKDKPVPDSVYEDLLIQEGLLKKDRRAGALARTYLNRVKDSARNFFKVRGRRRRMVAKFLNIKTICDHDFIDSFDNNSTIIDLGSSEGDFARGILELYPDINIILVELAPDLFRDAKTFFSGIDNVKLLNAAVTQTPGEATDFFLSKSHYYNSVCKNIAESGGGLRQESACARVRSTNLNEIITSFNVGEIALLKIDIEGMEWDLIDNLRREDCNRIRQITVEFHDFVDPALRARTERCIHKLRGFGYSFICEGSNIGCGTPYFNCLFYKKGIFGKALSVIGMFGKGKPLR